jgi:hypothetical protein
MLKRLLEILAALLDALKFKCRYCGGREIKRSGYYEEITRCANCFRKV